MVMEQDNKSNVKKDADKGGKTFEVLPVPKRVNRTNNVDYSKKVKDIANRLMINEGRVTKAVFWLLVILIVGFGGGWLGAAVRSNQLGLTGDQTKEIVSNQNQLTAAIANDVDPSVVSIDATGQTETQDVF